MSVSAADVAAARRWLTDQLGAVEIADDAVLDRAADVLLRRRGLTGTNGGDATNGGRHPGKEQAPDPAAAASRA